jgi:hypothetical protein
MLLASAGVALSVAGPAYATRQDPATSAARVVGHHHATSVDTASARTAKKHKTRKHKSRKAHGRSNVWSQRTIYYYETIPAQWDWSLSTAVAKWNASGAKIRFVRVPTPRHARLVISYGNVGAKAGEATVGPMVHPWVRLSNYYRSVDANDATNRVEVMAVFAHELGHVLGFEHTSTRCGLMSPVLDVVGCGMVNAAKTGYYKCQTISKPLAVRLTRTYGGRARYSSSEWCLVDPMPPTLTNVAFATPDAAGSPMRVTWDVPSATPAGSRVQIRTWNADTCGTPRGDVALDDVPVSPGAWQHAVDETENVCVSLELVNRYGVGRAAVAHQVAARSAADETAAAG